ncbi:ATP-binding protein [Candidatus Uhrbacteria bacterium]|nr:ATP-binding protein [Candidatus Uhrbacteria bacterium]
MFIKRKAENILLKMLHTSKIGIIVGARQVGKTTLIQHVFKDEKVIFLNMDVEVDRQRFLSVSSLNPTHAILLFGNPKIFVLDEAQRLPEAARIIKGWYDASTQVKIFLLGSSSLNLLNQAAESLAGRNEKLFLPQLAFREILAAQEWYSDTFTDDHILKYFSGQVHEILMQSIVFGSYPEAITTHEKETFLIQLSSDYLLKDILQIGLVKTPVSLHRLLMLLAHQIGSEVSVHELSIALGISRQTVERYIELLEQTYVIFCLPAFSTNPRKEISKSKKIYFWDTGVRNAILKEFSQSPLRSDIGALWENWVISEWAKDNLLRGGTRSLYFWRSRFGGEVDLIVKEGDALSAYEIKWKKKTFKKTSFSKSYETDVQLIESGNPLMVY